MDASHQITDPELVGQQTRTGISWSLIAAVAINSMRLVGVIVLGRTLDADAFGIAAAALAVIIVLSHVRDAGVSIALMQRPAIAEAHVTTAFGVAVYAGLVLGGLVALAAPLIGDAYGIPEAVPILRAFGAMFALRGVSVVSLAMCRREMRFRGVVLVDIAAAAVAIGTSIVLALQGAGAWALAGGFLVEEGLSTIGYVALRPPRGMRIHLTALRDLIGFGLQYTAMQVGHILAQFGDSFVVGRQLGSVQLGYYSRAFDLMQLPSSLFSTTIGSVLLPAFSRLQEARTHLQDAYRRAVFASALVVLPASAALFVMAPELIRLLLGPDWGPAVLPFRILTLAMFLRTGYRVAVLVAVGTGAVRSIAVVHAIYAAAVLIGAGIGSRWGTAGVAVAVACAIFVNYLLCAVVALRASGLATGELVGAHGPGLAIAALVAGASWPLAEALRSGGMAVGLRFAVVIGAGIAITLGAIVLWTRSSRPDPVWLRGELLRVLRRG